MGSTRNVFIAWACSAGALVLLAWILGAILDRGPLGILIDNRGRYSLTHLQLVLWSILVLSLVSGVFWGRLIGHAEGSALGFAIPDELLAVLGISVGSSALSSVVKAGKDPESIAASGTIGNTADRPRFAQIFLVEEGPMGDKVIDVAKYQNFWITLILAVDYGALAISTIDKAVTVSALKVLPGFSATMVTLLGISHAGYIAGKLPDRKGTPEGLNAKQLATKVVPTGFAPRHP